MTRRSKSNEQTRHFRIGVVGVSLTTPMSGLLEQYTSLYRGFQIDDPDVRAIRVQVAPTRFSPWHRRRYVVSVNDRVQFEPARLEEVLPYVDWAVNWEVPRVMPRKEKVSGWNGTAVALGASTGVLGVSLGAPEDRHVRLTSPMTPVTGRKTAAVPFVSG